MKFPESRHETGIFSEEKRAEPMLTEPVFWAFSEMVRNACGISLNSGKKELVKARLQKRLYSLRLPDFKAYLAYLRGPSGREEWVHFLDVLSTNVTGFFREARHFEYLRKVLLPRWSQAKRTGGMLRIWSAGCASGEEPYSIGMLLQAAWPEWRQWDIKILGTDLSSEALSRAKQGLYDAQSVQGVPAGWLDRFFEKDKENPGRGFRIGNSVRRMVYLARLNLLEDWPMRGGFDLICCRNVMIYFEFEIRQRLIQRFHERLNPGGTLFIGHSETLTTHAGGMQYVEPAVYEKK